MLSDQSSIGVHVGHWHVQTINMTYYMALSHKDWELPNSWIWLAETDIDRGLDFPIDTGIQADNVLQWKSCELKCKIIDCFHLTIFVSVSGKNLMRKKSKEDEQNLEEWLQNEVYGSLFYICRNSFPKLRWNKSESRGPIVICFCPIGI